MGPVPPQDPSDDQKAALVDRILRGELTPDEACAAYGVSQLELRQWVRVYTRAARRAVDDQVAAALSAHGLEVDELPATEFSGNLDNMAVAELIQTIQYGKKDAQIRIEHAGEQSHIWCVGGDVVDAQTTLLTGSAAVYRLLSLRQGRLHADFSPVRRARSIHASTQALMLEAAKRFDECREIRERLGDTRAVYVPSASAPPESEIEPDQAQVLRAFDGSRSVDQVVHDSEFPDLETLGMVHRLLEQRWLAAKPLPLARRPVAHVPAKSFATTTDASFMPIAASMRGRLTGGQVDRRTLWGSALAGVLVVAGAFAVGFYSARSGDSATFVAASGGPARERRSCPGDMANIAGRFCLGKSEVTAGEYQACVAAGACESAQREVVRAAAPGAAGAGAEGGAAARCNGGLPGRERYSINCLTFQQSKRYCEWHGGRLPTEGEWQLAAAEARAGTTTLADLLGSLSEWTSEQGSTSAPNSAPEGTLHERYAVLGGGLNTGPSASGTPARMYMSANAHGRSVGFRCALSLAPAEQR